MLGNPASLPCCHTRIAQRIQEGRFTMVNVSHDGDYWWPLHHFIFIEVAFFDEETLNISAIHFNLFFSFNTVVYQEKFDGIAVQGLVLSDHDTHHEELLDDFSWFALDAFCNFCHCHTSCVFQLCRQFMEFSFCHWFDSLVILTFFVFLTVPVTISLISHLILVTSILLLSARAIFHIIAEVTFLLNLSCFFTASIDSCWCRSWSRSQRLGFQNWFLKLDLFNFWLVMLFGFLGLAEAFFTTASVFSVLLCF